MMINFRPISFHCSSTACDGLGAGFGGSFFAASCATAGNTASPVANANPATHFSCFIVSLLRSPRMGRDVLSIRRAAAQGVSPVQRSLLLRYPAFRGGSSYAVIQSPSSHIPIPRMLNLYFTLGGAVTVNWSFLLLRIIIGLSIVALLYF